MCAVCTLLPIPPVTYYVLTARRCSAAAMPAPFTNVETMANVVMRNGEVRVHGEVSLVGARSRANSQGDFACAKAAVLKTN